MISRGEDCEQKLRPSAVVHARKYEADKPPSFTVPQVQIEGIFMRVLRLCNLGAVHGFAGCGWHWLC